MKLNTKQLFGICIEAILKPVSTNLDYRNCIAWNLLQMKLDNSVVKDNKPFLIADPKWDLPEKMM